MLRAMFPHDNLPDGPYERTRDSLLIDASASPRLTALLAQGVQDLDTLAGRPFNEQRLVEVRISARDLLSQDLNLRVLTTKAEHCGSSDIGMVYVARD